MSIAITDKKIAAAFEKKRIAQNKAYQKQIARVKSPEYKAKQLEKARKAKAKQIAKMNTSEYRAKQLEKAMQYSKKQKEKPSKVVKIKSKGLKGKSRTVAEVSLHNAMSELGCICCLNHGLFNEESGKGYVSIHHIKGRTIKAAHIFCLPLCAYHHDTPLPKALQAKYPKVFPIHAKNSVGGKVLWESVNGFQVDLLKQVFEILGLSLQELLEEY